MRGDGLKLAGLGFAALVWLAISLAPLGLGIWLVIALIRYLEART